jgi:hypothetical protein
MVRIILEQAFDVKYEIFSRTAFDALGGGRDVLFDS